MAVFNWFLFLPDKNIVQRKRSLKAQSVYRNREYDLKAGDLPFIDCAERH